jgi:hypothetical protein
MAKKQDQHRLWDWLHYLNYGVNTNKGKKLSGVRSSGFVASVVGVLTEHDFKSEYFTKICKYPKLIHPKILYKLCLAEHTTGCVRWGHRPREPIYIALFILPGIFYLFFLIINAPRRTPAKANCLD